MLIPLRPGVRSVRRALLALLLLLVLSLLSLPSPQHAAAYQTLQLVGQLDITADSIAVEGSTAYVLATFDANLQSVNIANPSAPAVRDVLALPYSLQDIAVQGNRAYIANSNKGVRVVNISNPADLMDLGAYSPTTYPSYGDIAVSGDYAYAVGLENGLSIINVANPASMYEAGRYPTIGYAHGVAVSGNYVYIADNDKLRIVNVANRSQPQEVGSVETPGNTKDVIVDGSHAYVADGLGGLSIFDVSNVSAPTLLGSVDTPGNAWNVAVSGNRAYVSDDVSGVQIVDISNRRAPAIVGGYDTPSYTHDIAVVGDLLYVADAAKLLVLRDPGAQQGVDCARFIADLSIPDGTVVSAGQALEKRWSLQNCGTTSWSGYQAVRIAGDYGPENFSIDGSAGQRVRVATTFTAPTASGRYRATYKLQGPGDLFGDTFWVEVVVREGQRSFTISGRVTTPSGAGIGGAAVMSSNGASNLTEGDGGYELSNIPPGSYTVSVAKEDYAYSEGVHTVTGPPDAMEVNFVGERVEKPKRQVVVLVHGWQGLERDPFKYRCEHGVFGPFSQDRGNRPPEFGQLAQQLYDQGYAIYLANWTSSLLSTMRAEDAAAQCLGPQIQDVKQRDPDGKAILIAHSMGGLVGRAYIESSGYRDDVEQLITLGTPHVGVNMGALIKILAYIYPQTSGGAHLLCNVNPGTCQLSTEQVTLFNLLHAPRDSLWYRFVGGDGGYPWAQLVFATEGPNDGIVGRASATGRLFPFDTEIVRGRTITRWYTNGGHQQIVGVPEYFDEALTKSCVNLFLSQAGDRQCSSTPVAARMEVADDSSTAPAYTPVLSGTLATGDIYTATLQLDGSEAALLLGWDRGDLTYSLTAPDGTAVTSDTVDSQLPGSSYDGPGTDGELPLAVYALKSPAPGTWQVTISAHDVLTQTNFVLFGAMRSPVGLQVDVPPSVESGQPFTVTATLTNGVSLLPGAQILGSLDTDRGQLPLVFAEMAPGRYAAQVVAPSSSGAYHLSVVATGGVGQPLSRQEDLVLTVRSSDVRLRSVATEVALDSDKDGRAESLRVTAPISVTRAGSYVAVATLRNAQGEVVAETRLERPLDPASAFLTFDFDGDAIRQHGVSGPYTVDLAVISTDTAQLSLDLRPLLQTRPYRSDDFGAASATSKVYLPLVSR